PAISNVGVTGFQLHSFTGTVSNVGLLKNLKGDAYDIDKYLSDNTTTLIAVALFVVTFIFFAGVMLFVILVTYLNIRIYLDRKYYSYLLDIEIIDKLK
ncbi:MAG: hypothetical protein PHQ95_01790, partial [Candidatus Gracilibacteria bacterium]|nr:hypothetical protein [Candidatus Gracilibacteria bacterium]